MVGDYLPGLGVQTFLSRHRELTLGPQVYGDEGRQSGDSGQELAGRGRCPAPLLQRGRVQGCRPSVQRWDRRLTQSYVQSWR